MCSAVEIVGGHQQLQAELTWDVRVGDAGLLTVLLVVVQIFNDLLQDDTVDVLEMTYAAERLAEVACELLVSLPRLFSVDVLCMSSIRRIVPDLTAADRRMWNSKPSEDTRVTYGDPAASFVVMITRRG